jgi:hypothetical protein
MNGPVRGSAMFRSVLAEVADGIRSTAEGDLRDLIRAARLPTPLIIPLHFSPQQIRRERSEVTQRIKGALERGLQRPPLPIRTVPCSTADRPSQ